MNLLDKFRPLQETRNQLKALGADPFNVVVEKILSPTEAIVNGHRVILAGTNNYLGLTFHPECIEAAVRALREEGCGTTGSRMANGNYADHQALEREFAEFYGLPYGVVFSAGYLANLALLSTLPGADDVILIDADCHASIYDGCKMSAAEVIRFRHNDVADLDKRLRRLKDRARRALVVVEGIYSMFGDRAPLREIVEVKDRYGAFLMVDEAHSLGVLGEQGRGLVEAEGVIERTDFIVGTFSKSLGAIGGYCVSPHQALDTLRYAARPYIFTASSSPAQIASTRVALHLLRDGRELRRRLWDNAERFYDGLKALGCTLGPQLSPVVPVILSEDRGDSLALWKALLERGVYVNLVMPPATPDHRCLLRCSMSAAHTPAQIDRLLDTFAQVFAAHGLTA
ncbi:8-amino-7-oxononanoate synthase [Methylomarinovum caldicuralii]|uniref:8-amino-7-oxononanoate synthase n=1 Tax=Methylomarinovum caldicuralii TaxID=438856 RepID=A0AAU9CA92_9GAMM|nr:aminotransferase class I/II-fold pyridoxal phosphate-dependent enzyme [Methylomarinovum caldicuralii]BCX81424.1 8-amino-7-oxononanoate synthase [Methylomarinovum caldicuralii]